ncbi:MAG TPA: HDOD domain-containing protein [Polyangiaceae bacterium]|nr:HDOD domain-containing protein [Polyangiaceae bacterium]
MANPNVQSSKVRGPGDPAASSRRGVLADNVIEELWFGDEDPKRSQLEASRSMAAALGIATGLRPFPVVLQKALALLRDPDAPRRKVVELIEQDPALTSRLLRVANSALYGGARTCHSVMDAVMRLGNRTVSDLITGIAVLGMFADVGGYGARVRDHSAAVAAIARVLAIEWRHSGTDHVFLAGLMHDIGKLLMVQAGTPRYEQIPKAVLAQADRVHVEERHLVGYDHATLGAHVLSHWQLPVEVSRVVAWHHRPGRAFEEGGEVALDVALVRLSDHIELAAASAHKPDAALWEQIGKEEATQYAGFDVAAVEAMWPKLLQARTEALSALTR